MVINFPVFLDNEFIHVNAFDGNALGAFLKEAGDRLQIGFAVDLLMDLVDDDAEILQVEEVAGIAQKLDVLFHAVLIFDFELVFAVDGDAGLEFAESLFDFLPVHAFQWPELDIEFGRLVVDGFAKNIRHGLRVFLRSIFASG